MGAFLGRGSSRSDTGRPDHLGDHALQLVVESLAVDEVRLDGLLRDEGPVGERRFELVLADLSPAADVGRERRRSYSRSMSMWSAFATSVAPSRVNASGADLCAPMRTNCARTPILSSSEP